MKYKLQRMIQIALLGFFIFLIIKGRVQLWVGLLLGGIVLSFLFGRFYCGWMCSINTVLADYLDKKEIKNQEPIHSEILGK